MKKLMVPFLLSVSMLVACADAKFSGGQKAGPPLEVLSVQPQLFDAYACPPDTTSEKKAFVCHVPPGDPTAQHNVCISKTAVDNHLSHSKDLPFLNTDYLGICVPIEDRV
jgi:hypothetical protein